MNNAKPTIRKAVVLSMTTLLITTSALAERTVADETHHRAVQFGDLSDTALATGTAVYSESVSPRSLDSVVNISRWDAGTDSLYPRGILYEAGESPRALADMVGLQRSFIQERDEAYDSLSESEQPTLMGWWETWNQPYNRQPFDWQTHCGSGVIEVEATGAVLQCWLNFNPAVKQAMIWQDMDPWGQVTLKDYDQWDGFMKTYLNEHFSNYFQWLEGSATVFPAPTLPDPPVNQWTLADDDFIVTRLSKLQAQVIYLQNVAHSLALEIGGFVPWSILHYYPDELERLLASASFYNVGVYPWNGDTNPELFEFFGYRPKQVTQSPPTTTFAFLVKQDVLQPSHYDTIGRFLKWGREHMSHWYNGYDTENVEFHWHYRGQPPVERMVSGVTKTTSSGTYTNHWTMGCWGTTYFFREVLRAANIPVMHTALPEPETDHGHSTPVFTTINRMLSHADDVYGVRFNIPSVAPSYLPPEWLLIDQVKLLTWFGKGSYNDKHKNVSRQIYDIAIQILPDKLMEKYCDDKEYSRSHADSKVSDTFSHLYSVQELEAKNLWQRLSTKNAQYGYCPDTSFASSSDFPDYGSFE